ncbi:MAG: tetratricopeptide repeat protein, partial [Polyangiales bacterium]
MPAEAENDEGNEDEGRDEDDDEDEGASRVPAPDSGTAEAPALPSSATDAAVLEAMQAAIRVKLWSRAIWLIEQRMQQGGAARLWWELGHALAGRKQTVAAMHAFRRYLEAEPGSWDRAHVETRLAELGRTPAKVALRSTPAGASVHIDDVAQPDKTPTTLH